MMGALEITPLADTLSFGSRVRGATRENLQDAAIRTQLFDLFEQRGVIVFDEVESSAAMLVAISEVFGPLKEHPVPSITRVDGEHLPGVIDFAQEPENGDIVEVDGVRLLHWLPWHFDHCYNDELNRAAVLRAVTIAPDGGQTGFADGIALYQALSPELRAAIDDADVIYKLNLIHDDMRFGKPASFRTLSVSEDSRNATAHAKHMRRAIHPMVWTRPNGEKVLHVTGWMAEGIAGRENAEGDALLEAVCQEINTRAVGYFHDWRPDQMVVWDNWRMLHSVTGSSASHPRRMQRTTILGDYGLGRFEDN